MNLTLIPLIKLNTIEEHKKLFYGLYEAGIMTYTRESEDVGGDYYEKELDVEDAWEIWYLNITYKDKLITQMVTFDIKNSFLQSFIDNTVFSNHVFVLLNSPKHFIEYITELKRQKRLKYRL